MPIPSLSELDSLHRNMCQAIGDPRRIQILYALYEKPRHVTALADLLDAPQPTISRHLSVLRQRGLVLCERDGAAMVYRLADERIITVLDMMRGLLREFLTKQVSLMEEY